MQTKDTVDRDAPQTKSKSATVLLACAWPALLLATVCVFPFLNKPFAIDDPWFLTMARQIVNHPTHPMDFTICWNVDPNCAKASAWASGNPLLGQVGQGYVLVPTALAGAREWIAHLTQLVFAWIAIVAMASFVLRLGWDRWHATTGALLLVAIPPFLPMTATAMPDIAGTAIALVAIERLAAWKAEQHWSQGAAAAIALGLAGFARPHLVLFLPLAAFFLLDGVSLHEALGQIRRKWWLWIPVFLGCGLVVTIIFAVREHVVAIGSFPAVVRQESIRNNLYTFLLYFAFPLPVTVCWLANRLSTGRFWTAFFVFGAALLPVVFRWNLALVLFFMILGLCVVANLVFEAAKTRVHSELFLMLWILIPLPIVFYAHLPMKYILPCVPAVILLCFRLLDGVSVRSARVAVMVLIVAGTGYSLVILRADAEFAEFGRDALFQLIKPRVESGERVWYGGQYWSYWYAPLAGARLTYEGGPEPKVGDLLVVDVIADGQSSPLKRFPHRTLVEAISHKYRFGRTVGGGIGGLYSGFWLWTLGNRLDDRYELWRID